MRLLTKALSFKGIGLHTGHPCRVTLRPWPKSRVHIALKTGNPLWELVKSTQAPKDPCPITPAIVRGSENMTSLDFLGRRIRTVEHLLSSLLGLRVAGVSICVKGEEIPALDGSARVFAEELWNSTHILRKPWPTFTMAQPWYVKEGVASIEVIPSSNLRIEYQIEYNTPWIGVQTHSINLKPKTYFTDIAPARTFGFLKDAEHLRSKGLALGATPENTLIFTDSGPLNPPLRFSNELVRHKILDFVGDLALLGGVLPNAVIRVVRGSHYLHQVLVKKLWEQVSAKNPVSPVKKR